MDTPVSSCAAPARSGPWRIVVLLVATGLAHTAQADTLSAIQTLRAGGCGGLVPIASPLRRSFALERTAREWAGGAALAVAAAHNGYHQLPSGVHVRAADAALLEGLRRSDCRALANTALREIGVYHRGQDYWFVMSADEEAAPTSVTRRTARPEAPPPSAARAPPAPLLSARALELVNAARARGARCGRRQFAPVPPVTLSGTLAGVALGHAAEMAAHNYFEHQDLAGQSPADRVRATGYREKLVGENIAYGPQSVEEAVKGWLDSPDHCENIMDPRFAEMGIASAAGRASRQGRYWVQVLAEPRA